MKKTVLLFLLLWVMIQNAVVEANCALAPWKDQVEYSDAVVEGTVINARSSLWKHIWTRLTSDDAGKIENSRKGEVLFRVEKIGKGNVKPYIIVVPAMGSEAEHLYENKRYTLFLHKKNNIYYQRMCAPEKTNLTKNTNDIDYREIKQSFNVYPLWFFLTNEINILFIIITVIILKKIIKKIKSRKNIVE